MNKPLLGSTPPSKFFGRESLAADTATALANKQAKRLTEQLRLAKLAAPAADSLSSPRQRLAMVQQVRETGIRHPRVLDALNSVQRHLFLDPGLASRSYEDIALPIGHQQTISRPSVVGRMLELSLPPDLADSLGKSRRKQGVALEIGTGCGYAGAVMAQVFDRVVSIERIKALHEIAKHNVSGQGFGNLALQFGDGLLGCVKHAPYDAIIIAAAGLEVPQTLLLQLRLGGRLVAPLVLTSGKQVLQLIERVSELEWRSTQLEEASFVPLRSGVVDQSAAR